MKHAIKIVCVSKQMLHFVRAAQEVVTVESKMVLVQKIVMIIVFNVKRISNVNNVNLAMESRFFHLLNICVDNVKTGNVPIAH